MASESKVPPLARLGEDFELDLQSYQLRRAGRVLKLERIPMEVLLLLVERRNQIVTREEIAARVWGKDVFLDTDNSINGAVRKIRQVLRDDSEQPRFIQTITGQGYRFIAPVVDDLRDGVRSASMPELAARSSDASPMSPLERSDTETDISVASLRAASSTGEEPRAFAPAIWRRFVPVGIGVVLIGGVGGWLLGSQFSTRPHQSGARVMLAVLPFENLTGDPSQEYFTDGMTQEMITELGNLDPRHLGVIARTSVMHYKHGQTALDQVGRDLGVEYVIEGSVRRDADRIRVNAQLIQTKDQTHVWARAFDREIKGILPLQGEIAHEIADEIELTLGNHRPISLGSPDRPAEDYETYDLYLKGQYFFNKRSAADLEQAIGFFQRAISKDRNNARAYAGLADSYALMAGYSGRTQAEFMGKARAAALRALELDSRLPEGHTALALIVQNYDWDWETAEREYRRAIDLNPNYATAHHWYAEHLMWRGRFNEALQESERARQLDPLSLIIAADNGAILFYSRQYDRAIDKWRSVLEMDPNFRRAHLIAQADVEKGKFAEALADTENHAEIRASVLSWSAYIYGRSGQTAEARRALLDLLRLNRSQPMDPLLIAWAYIGLGDKDQALVWLEKAYSQRSVELVTLRVNPGYDPLRGDPRFQDLLRRVGLAG